MTKQVKGIIEDWVLVDYYGELSVLGYAHDFSTHDPKTTEFQNGHRVITSQVQGIEIGGTEVLVQTRNSLYQLGNRKIVPDAIPVFKMEYVLPVYIFSTVWHLVPPKN